MIENIYLNEKFMNLIFEFCCNNYHIEIYAKIL